jgi:peptidoglycan glycosyltransferase
VLTHEGAGRRTKRGIRRHRLLTHGLPVVVLAAAAFGVGIYVAGGPGRAQRALVSDYVHAWARGGYAEMYSLLDSASKQRITEARFVADYQAAAQTATLSSLVPLRVGNDNGGVIAVAMVARTRLFGKLHQTLLVPVDTSGSSPTVRFGSTLLFPGLRPGEALTRQVTLPPRAALLARDGTPLAEGSGRTSPIPDVASQIVGVLGPIPATLATTYSADGYPATAKVGQDGLERVFERQLAGTAGGTLLAGARSLAHTSPKPGHPVTTTIDPTIERAAVAALAGRYGGIAAMQPRTGQLLALAGVAFSSLQPPGSTMKIITATGALDAGIVKLTDVFPIQTSTTISGFNLQNANGEACGGTFLNAFAVSCNSVFAPLGAKLGAKRLVSIAERFGFNQTPSIPGAAEPTIPSAATIGDDLAVGTSAIGQGAVQASALEMTDVGATIAMGGRRPIPTLQNGRPARFVHVTSPQVAGQVQRMMIAVVQFGTGTSAAISGVEVAGKTGTAELANTADPNNPNAGSAQNTDAWFVGYAPAGAPRIVVGALFPNQGAGGTTAAPAAREVLLAGLQAK